MGQLEDEIARRFPGERIRYTGAATIRPIVVEEGERKKYAISSPGKLILTDKHLVFSIDKRNYNFVMVFLALLFVFLAVIILLQGISFGSLFVIAVAFLITALLEVIVILERQRFSMVAFELAKSEIEGSKETGKLTVKGEMKSEVRWLTQKKGFEITIAEGEKFPKL